MSLLCPLIAKLCASTERSEELVLARQCLLAIRRPSASRRRPPDSRRGAPRGASSLAPSPAQASPGFFIAVRPVSAPLRAAVWPVTSRDILPHAEAQLLQSSWPGDVRELANVPERVVLLHAGDEIHGGDPGLSPAAAGAGAVDVGAAVIRVDFSRGGVSLAGVELTMILEAFKTARTTGGGQRTSSTSFRRPCAIASRRAGSSPGTPVAKAIPARASHRGRRLERTPGFRSRARQAPPHSSLITSGPWTPCKEMSTRVEVLSLKNVTDRSPSVISGISTGKYRSRSVSYVRP